MKMQILGFLYLAFSFVVSEGCNGCLKWLSDENDRRLPIEGAVEIDLSDCITDNDTFIPLKTVDAALNLTLVKEGRAMCCDIINKLKMSNNICDTSIVKSMARGVEGSHLYRILREGEDNTIDVVTAKKIKSIKGFRCVGGFTAKEIKKFEDRKNTKGESINGGKPIFVGNCSIDDCVKVYHNGLIYIFVRDGGGGIGF